MAMRATRLQRLRRSYQRSRRRRSERAIREGRHHLLEQLEQRAAPGSMWHVWGGALYDALLIGGAAPIRVLPSSLLDDVQADATGYGPRILSAERTWRVVDPIPVSSASAPTRHNASPDSEIASQSAPVNRAGTNGIGASSFDTLPLTFDPELAFQVTTGDSGVMNPGGGRSSSAASSGGGGGGGSSVGGESESSALGQSAPDAEAAGSRSSPSAFVPRVGAEDRASAAHDDASEQQDTSARADQSTVVADVPADVTSGEVNVTINPDTPEEQPRDAARRSDFVDQQRSDVATLQARGRRGSITLDAKGRGLTEVSVAEAPLDERHGVLLPYGLFSFNITDVEPGGRATVDMHLPEDADVDGYYKLEPDSGQYWQFAFDGTTGAVINGDVITLHFVDGGRGDADGLANGVIVDPGGPGVVPEIIGVTCTGADGLGGWSVVESGGDQTPGSVNHENGQLVLQEGDSLLVSFERTVTIPDNPSILQFTYTATFDTTDPDFINDAFEVALVDANGVTVVPHIGRDRDSFFNETEGLAPALGDATTLNSGTVTLDISKTLPGSQATIIFRLVNNDSDTAGAVRLTCEPAPSVTIGLANDTAPTGPGSAPYLTDLLTNDPRVSGSATDDRYVMRLEASIDGGAFFDITSNYDPQTNDYLFDPGALAPGSRTITVRATDAVGLSDEASLTFTVNTPPVPDAGSYTVIDEGDSITLDAAGSTDVDGPLFAYEWTLEDGSTATGSTVTRHFADNGSYSVTLEVTDTAGSVASDGAAITVNNVAPTMNASFSHDVASGSDGVARVLTKVDATFSDPGFTNTAASTAETFTVSIDWDDGTVDTLAVTSVAQGSAGVLTTGSFSAEHLYQTGGIYDVTVTLVDDDNGSALETYTFQHTRIDVKPLLDVAVPPTVPEYLGLISVVIFGDPGFDATQIVPSSLRFGPGQAPIYHDDIHDHDEPEAGGPPDSHDDRLAHFGLVETIFGDPANPDALNIDELVAFLLGTQTVLEGDLAGGTHFIGIDTFEVLPNLIEDAGEIIGAKPLAGTTKFFVVDADDAVAYEYGFDAMDTGSFALSGSDPGGVTSNLTGDRVWTIDATTHDVSVQDGDGAVLGNWTALNLTNPQGVATDGINLWIVDPGSDQVEFFPSAAAHLAGEFPAADFFALDPANESPSGLTTDGQRLWVTDDGADQVFVYDLAGNLVGQWQLDFANTDPSGITLDPAGGNDLWVVDRTDAAVYHYADAAIRTSGRVAYNRSYPLNTNNQAPEGIADPCGECAAGSGTEYWMAFPYESRGPNLLVGIASETAASGTVSVPGISFSTNFNVAPGEVAQINIFPSGQGTALLTGSDVVLDKGVHVVADVPVSVYGQYATDQFPDGFVAVPAEELGTDYVVLSYGGGTSQFAVVGTQDNTTVTITPSVSTGTRAAGIAYNVTLDQGEAYQLQEDSGEDLTGSIITSDKQVAVLSGNVLTSIPAGYSSAGYLVEQMLSTDQWGSHYLTMPLAGRSGGDTFRILAASDQTRVWIDDVEVALLDRGEFHEQILEDPTEIIADQPVLVAQYAHSRSFDNSMWGNPFQMLLPPLEVFRTTHTLSESEASAFDEYVNVIAPAAAVGAVSVDGQLVPDTDFVPIGGSGFWGAQVAVPTGDNLEYHHIESPLPVGVLYYGGDWIDNHGYASNISQLGLGPSIEIIEPAEATRFPASSSQLITGVVTPGNSPIASVTVNGQPVDALDAAFNFFTKVLVQPGINSYTFTAMDSENRLAAVTLTLEGVDPDDVTPQLVDVTPSMTSFYGRTSFNQATDFLYADLSVQNAGDYIIDGPLWVAVTNISEPTVALRETDGTTSDRLPYFDLSSTMSMSTLGPGESTGERSLVFSNPSGKPFTYDLAYRSRVNAIPMFTSIPLVDAVAGDTYTYGASGSDPDDHPLQFELLVGPPAMSVDQNTGVVTWSPASGDVGRHDLVLAVMDDRGGVTEQHFTLTVAATPPNRPPVLDAAPPPEAYVNRPYTFTVSATDMDGDSLNYQLTTKPTGMSIDAQTMTWTPTPSEVPSQDITLVVSDGQGGSTTLDFSVCVHPEPNSWAPSFITNPTTTSVIQGQTFTYNATALDSDGDALNYSVQEPYSGLTVDAATGEITWDTMGISTGPYDLTISVTDGRGWSATQTITVTVTNDAPAQISGTVFDDTDGDGLRNGGELGLADRNVYLDQNQNRVRDDGEVTVITDASGAFALMNLAAGDYHLLLEPLAGNRTTSPAAPGYEVSLTAGASVTARDFGSQSVAGPNQPPTLAVNPPVNAGIGQLFTFDAASTDPDGDAATYDLPVAPRGMAVDADSGIVAWIPSADQTGTHDALLRVSDNRGGVDTFEFQVTVAAANVPPVITSMPGDEAVQDRPFTYRARAQDADGDALTWSLDEDSETAGMQIDVNSGVVTWTPAAAHVGQHSVTVTVDDGTDSIDQTLTLVVRSTAPNFPPVMTSSPPTVVQLRDTWWYPVRATDANHDPLTITLDTQAVTPPTGMSIDSQGLLQWTPTQSQLGSHHVQVKVDDGQGGVVTQAIAISVVARHGNQPPNIKSAPTPEAPVDRLYGYDLAASDPENEAISWSLQQAPAGMSLDSETGTLRWTPLAHQVGSHEVVVHAADVRGSIARHVFTLVVPHCNNPPVIDSAPPTTGAVGIRNYYLVRAGDADSDVLSYSLSGEPPGMSIDSETGLVRWLPDSSGSFTFTVIADDGSGGSSQQAVTVVVSATTPNRPPVIESQPVRFARVDNLYSYQVAGCDPDGDDLVFDLPTSVNPPSPPAGMAIDSNTGLIEWTPTAAGVYPVVVTVEDPGGKSSQQHFQISVTMNQPPQITSAAVDAAIAGLVYRYDVRADDADGDRLAFELDDAPAGMAIDPLGRITWEIPVKDKASGPDAYPVSVTLRDAYGGSDSQSFTLTVSADTQPPQVRLTLLEERTSRDLTFGGGSGPLLREVQGPVLVGHKVRVLVSTSDNVAVDSVVLTVDGENLSLDQGGMAELTPDAEATYSIAVTATDEAGNPASASQSLEAVEPTDPPLVQISSPDGSQPVTAPIDVVGTASDADDFTDYRLDLFSMESRHLAQLGSGTTPVSSGVLGQLDPTTLPNGPYFLRLTASDATGNTVWVDRFIDVAGKLKLGNFTVSFEDLTIPVAGIPITISRHYDTLAADQEGDFGHGWRLSFGDPDLQVDIPGSAGNGWGGYPAFLDGTRVYVSTPDGQRQGFTFQPVAEGSWIGPTYYHPRFVPDDDNHTSLTAEDVKLNRRGNGEYYTIGASGIRTYNPADPVFGGQYQLHTFGGLTYNVDGETGKLASAEDRNGNRLTFGANAIDSNRGRSVNIERDFRGRVTKITDPRGNSVQYAYNGSGDLVKVTDRLGNETSFTYLTAAGGGEDHYLDEIVDPLGRPAVKNTFDAGRLSQVTDANGETVALAYDTATLTQTITDQNGKSATIGFDTRGNMIREENQAGNVVLRSYQTGTDYLTSETTVIGLPDDPSNGETDDLTTSYQVNSQGLPTRETDPRGNETRTSYDAQGQPTRSTDPLGNTTENIFDSKGNLSHTIDPSGKVTAFQYDTSGNVVTITTDAAGPFAVSCMTPSCQQQEAQGTVTQFEYNQFGDLVKTIDNDENERTIVYDENGNQTGTSFTWTNPADPNDTRVVSTSNVFDAGDRGTQNTTPSGTTTTDYDALDRAFRTTDELGRVSETVYDQRGLTIETRSVSEGETGSPVWLVSQTVYDAAGRAIYSGNSHPEGTPDADITGTHTIYDDAGRVIATEQLVGLDIDIIDAATGQEVTDPAGSGLSTLVSQLSAAGSVISTTSTVYDDAGRVTETTDAFARKAQTLYDRFGQTIETRSQSRDATGTDVWLVSRTVYDQYGRVDLTTDQFILASTCALGACASPPVHATRSIYDKQGRVVKTERLKEVIVEIQGATGSASAVVTDPGTLLTTSETIYGDQGRVSRTIAADGQTTEFEYDAQGRQTATIGHAVPAEDVGLGTAHPGKLVRHRTETQYNQYGQVSRQIANIAQVEDAQGNLITIDRTNEQKSDFEYDEHGNRVQTIFGVSTPAESYVLVRYDSFGRQTAEMQQTAAATAAVWSDTENSFVVSGSSPVQTIPTKLYEYDSEGRLFAVELPAVADPANSNQLTRLRYEYGYNEQGNQTLIRDPLDHETRFTFDVQGRQLTRTLPLGFGSDGRLTAGEQATGDFTERFEYDDRGRQTLHVSFEGVVTENIYDDTPINGFATGRLVERRFFLTEGGYNNGIGTPNERWVYSYDAFGRAVTVVQDNDGDLLTTSDQRVTNNIYDEQGRVTEVSSDEGVIAYGYDDLGRKTATSVYPADTDTSTATPERVTNYAYDALGRLESVSEDLDPTSTSDDPLDTVYAYDLLGNMDRTDLPNGVITDYTYDDLNRLDVMTDYAPDAPGPLDPSNLDTDLSNNQKLAEYDYEVRADGKRTSATETFWLDEDSNPLTAPTEHVDQIDWTYDTVGRLIDEVFNHFDDNLDQVEHFVYDLTGNRVEKTLNTNPAFDINGNPTDTIADELFSYLYDANDRLLTETLDDDVQQADSVEQTTAYEYGDSNEKTQQTRKTVTDNVTSQVSSVTTYAYSLQGRMSEVTSTEASGKVTVTSFEYDATGIRVASTHKIDTEGDGTFESQVRVENLVDHHNFTGYQQSITETHTDLLTGNVTKTIEYTYGHDEIAQTVTEFNPDGTVASEVTHVFGHDGHGSVRVLYDSAASILQLYAYSSYGEMLGIHDGQAAFIGKEEGLALTILLYSGEPYYQQIAMQYLRARFYDPATGRFNRLDPFAGNTQDPQSLHKYLYVHGDPIGGIDPTGETLSASFSVSGMVAAAIIGVNVLFVWGPELLWGIRALTGTRRDSSGVGGRDITPHLRDVQSEYMSQWVTRSATEKQAILASLNDIWPDGPRWNPEDYNALHGWDIHPLAFAKDSFGEERVNIPKTVTVNGNVYFPEEVNYFLIGLVYRMAYEDGDAGYRFENLDLKIRFYRHVSQFYQTGTGHIEGRVAWAKAGWRAGSGDPIQFPASDSVRLRNATANPTEHPQSLWTHVGESYGPPNHRIEFQAR